MTSEIYLIILQFIQHIFINSYTGAGNMFIKKQNKNNKKQIKQNSAILQDKTHKTYITLLDMHILKQNLNLFWISI